MNNKEIQVIVEREIAGTKAAIKDYKEQSKPVAPDVAIGRISRMDAINNKSVNYVALKNAELKLNNLQVAISKIDDADFGICIRCQNAIPIGRILLIPQAITCVNCTQ